MKSSPHMIAGAITLAAIIIFAVLKGVFDFKFGFRTYWPIFLCIYLTSWYYANLYYRCKPKNA